LAFSLARIGNAAKLGDMNIARSSSTNAERAQAYQYCGAIPS
jgi:hypothetical protein